MDKPTHTKKPEVAESDKAQESQIELAELTENDLDNVAGGLNPQPLPPRWKNLVNYAQIVNVKISAKVLLP